MEKILIIDDNKLIRKTLKETLSKVGYTVIEAEDGESGLTFVRSERPDLVITDFQMPGLNGFQFIRRAQRLLPDVPVLMITAVPDLFSEDEIKDLPTLKAIVRKPFKWEELAGHIERVLPAPSPPAFPSAGA